MKRCSKCKVEKDESEFVKDKNKKGGIKSSCKQCKKNYSFVTREANAKRARQWYLENKDRCLESRKKYKLNENYKDNKKRYLQKAKETLPDWYILRASTIRHLPRESITPELIEAVRLSIRIKRLIKEKQNA